MFTLRTFKYSVLCLLLPLAAFSQAPSASFTAGVPNPPCVPLTVPFTNSSTNATSYSWTIDGNFFSDEVDPERIFTTAGSYEICLEATGPNGTDTECTTIDLFTGPDFDFTASPASGCAPHEVTFTVNTSATDITEYTWDFGDGTITTVSTPTYTHTYNTSSIYDVTLTATNSTGCSNSVTQEDIVDVFSDVTPQFSANNLNSCAAPMTVSFTNTSTGNLSNVSFEWNFGDGNTSTTENPTHTYDTPGSYDVSLTITNNSTGCSNMTVTPNFINIGASPMFSYTTSNNGSCNQVTATFTNETPGDVVVYFWDFGDGNTSNLENPVHTYSADGCHTPSLTVTTTEGCVVTYDAPDCIEILGSIDLSYTTNDPTTACQAPLTVSFSTPYNGDIEWDFGGEGSSTAQNPTFTFTNEGSFPVTLTATLPNGCEQTVTSTTVVIAPPSVAFEGDVLEGCAPLTVNFSDLTNIPDNIVSWEWDFGDGGTSTDQNPTYTFQNPGEFDVQLTITLDNGCEGSGTWSNYIQAGYVPPVAFEADPTETCIENVIGFTDLSNDPNIDYWYWDFGDGSFSPEQNPLHEYNDTGYFDVQLIVGYNSCYDSLLIEDYTHLFPPKAIFYHSQDCSNPGMVTFTDSSLGADTWSWDFGDGNTSTEQNPSHFYTENGIYTVTLEVYNAESGCTDEMSVGIYVQVPIAGFEVNPTSACYTGSSVSLQVTNTSENAVSYSWYAPGIFIVLNGLNDPDPEFRFNSPGEYTGMQLTITDAAGCQDVFVYTDTITISEADADFSFENIDSDCNQVFSFTDESTSQYGEIITWEWDFGDGNTSTEQHPTHTYAVGGFYLPTLTITNDKGCSSTASITNPLQVETPFVSFNVNQLSCLGDDLTFNNESVASEFVTWEWDFGDGNTSSDWSPQHAYSTPGTYTACFTATNQDGCDGGFCLDIEVQNVSADFTADVTSASCSPLVVQFTDLSTDAVAWEWDFGDNTGISTLQHPAHTYTNSGSFDVCVTVTSSAGCEITYCQDDFIQIGGPTADVTYNPASSGCIDFDVTFLVDGNNVDTYVLDFGDGMTESGDVNDIFSVTHTYTSVGTFSPVLLLEDASGCQNFVELAPITTSTLTINAEASDNNFCAGTAIDFTSVIETPSNVQNIEWNFEGATTSTSSDANPTGILYNTGGTYDVTLTVTTNICTETIVLDNFINVLPQPVVSFNANPTSNCGPATVQFQNNTTISSGNIAAYSWDFGNGEMSTSQNPVANYTDVGVYTVTLTATSDEGCVDEFTQTVTILEEAIANIEWDEYTLCQGQSIEIEAEVNGNASWTPSNGLSCTNCPNPIANPTSQTTYYLTTTTPDGCTATDSITIDRVTAAPPVVTLTDDMTICEGEIVQIIATGGSSPFDYSWDTDALGLSCYENCSNPLVEITETTTFTVYVSNAAGCVTSESVTITVIGSDLDLLGPDRTVCLGGSVLLQTSAGTDPEWENDPTLSCQTCPNPVATPNQTTTYTVTVDYQGCPVTKDITVFVINPDEVDAGSDLSICEGQSINLDGMAPGNFSWSENGNVFNTEDLDAEVSPMVTTDYVLTAANDLCIVNDTVQVVVTDKLTLIVEDVETCDSGPVQLNAAGAGITDFDWSPADDLNFSDIPNPTATVSETTAFTVIGSNGLCEADTAIVTVFVTDGPEVILPQSQSFIPGSSVQIMPTTDDDGTYTYNWSPNLDISCTNCESPVVSPDSVTTYTLIVTNAQGCSTEANVTLVPILECMEDVVIVPTGFSPNNDGHNDELRALGLAEVQLFRVFNRWGELMFETTNSSDGWDGTFKGKAVNTDVYVWYLEAICPLDGSILTRKGDVTLIR